MGKDSNTLDVVIVGAGFAGLYMLHKLRSTGFTARVIDAASGVGGTWYWNRYPGARCDVESMFYSYGFDEELEQEWEWTERYPSQTEILRYANHVADRFSLWPHIQLNTRVASATYDTEKNGWCVTTESDEVFNAKFCIMATGCLSAANEPKFDGMETFAGRIFHTGRWPHQKIDFNDRRVGVIGTGSSGVQVIQEVAKEAAHLTVFQRTPTYVVESFNRPLDRGDQVEVKAKYQDIRAAARKTFGGFTVVMNEQSALSVSEEECRERLEAAWNAGGIGLQFTYNDFGFSEAANKRAQDFVRDKIRATVNDPDTTEKLLPSHILGCKRLSIGTNYYATYNKPNVSLVQLGDTGIEHITPAGVISEETLYPLDDLVLATGFDAMTGSLSRIHITGRNGQPLTTAWQAGPQSYLGLMTHGFPNLFTITGPGSPSVLSNMLPTIEHHVEWIAECIAHLREQNIREIEPNVDAQDKWVAHGNEVADKTLRHGCNSWYLGANVPGKPRVFMPYIGGMPAYREKCSAVAAAGYDGFELTES